MKTPQSYRSRMPALAIAGGLALFGVLSLGGVTQVLLADSADVVVADGSGSDSKPKPDCDRVCEK